MQRLRGCTSAAFCCNKYGKERYRLWHDKVTFLCWRRYFFVVGNSCVFLLKIVTDSRDEIKKLSVANVDKNIEMGYHEIVIFFVLY